MSGSLVRDRLESATAEVSRDIELLLRELTEADGGQSFVAVELIEAGVAVDSHASGEAADLQVLGVEVTLVDFDLVFKGVVTDSAASVDDLLNHGADLGSVLSEAEDEVTSNCGILV